MSTNKTRLSHITYLMKNFFYGTIDSVGGPSSQEENNRKTKWKID